MNFLHLYNLNLPQFKVPNTYLLTYILSYLLTYLLHEAESYLRSYLVLQLIKKFLSLYGTRNFIAALATARHLSLP